MAAADPAEQVAAAEDLPRSTGFLAVDSDQMVAATASLPDQIAAALARPPMLAGPRPGPEPSHVLVVGMGGSGVAGKVAVALAAGSSKIPVVYAGGYRLPAFVGPDSVVVAVSFSGETEETIELSTAALQRRASLVAISCGGELAHLAERAGARTYEIGAGISHPRAAIGAMTAPLLLLCEELGLISEVRAGLEAAVSQLRLRARECAGGGGLARQVADEIGRTIPLVHGASGLGAVAAERFKTQVNENAKAPCFSGTEPEVCHNEICGFGQGGDITRQVLTLVNLRLGDEHTQVRRRFRLFAELADETVARVIDIEAAGEGRLARFFDAVMIGDFASLHMAGREDVDPGPNPVLDEIKLRLAEGP
ncbi:MAG: SIS domain-containing protein [Acidimicrobiales bacterium]